MKTPPTPAQSPAQYPAHQNSSHSIRARSTVLTLLRSSSTPSPAVHPTARSRSPTHLTRPRSSAPSCPYPNTFPSSVASPSPRPHECLPLAKTAKPRGDAAAPHSDWIKIKPGPLSLVDTRNQQEWLCSGRAAAALLPEGAALEVAGLRGRRSPGEESRRCYLSSSSLQPVPARQ